MITAPMKSVGLRPRLSAENGVNGRPCGTDETLSVRDWRASRRTTCGYRTDDLGGTNEACRDASEKGTRVCMAVRT